MSANVQGDVKTFYDRSRHGPVRQDESSGCRVARKQGLAPSPPDPPHAGGAAPARGGPPLNVLRRSDMLAQSIHPAPEARDANSDVTPLLPLDGLGPRRLARRGSGGAGF